MNNILAKFPHGRMHINHCQNEACVQCCILQAFVDLHDYSNCLRIIFTCHENRTKIKLNRQISFGCEMVIKWRKAVINRSHSHLVDYVKSGIRPLCIVCSDYCHYVTRTQCDMMNSFLNQFYAWQGKLH